MAGYSRHGFHKDIINVIIQVKQIFNLIFAKLYSPEFKMKSFAVSFNGFLIKQAQTPWSKKCAFFRRSATQKIL